MDDTNEAGAEPNRKRLSISSWIVVLLVALIPSLFATAFSSYETFRGDVLTIGAAVALIAWMVDVVRGRRIQVSAGRITILLLAVGLYMASATIWGDHFLYGSRSVLPHLSVIALAFVMLAPAGRPVEFREFSIAMSTAILLTGAFGFLDLLGVGVFTPVWDPPGATGAFDSTENAVALYAVALPVVISAIFEFEGRLRYLTIPAFAFGGFHFAMMGAWSAAAVFGVGCLLSTLFVIAFQHSDSSFALYPVAVLIGVVAVFFASAGPLGLQPESGPNSATSLPRLLQSKGVTSEEAEQGLRNPVFSSGRTEVLPSKRALEYIAGVGFEHTRDRPLLGHGPGGWWHLQTKYPKADDPFVQGMFEKYAAFRSPHNAYIKFAVNYGLVGLFLFLAWLIGVFVISLEAVGTHPESPGRLLEHWGLITLALMGAVFASFTALLEFHSVALIWFAGLGLLTRYSAKVNAYEGWSQTWVINRKSGQGRHYGLAGLALFFAVALGVGGGFSAVSDYFRGTADNFMLHTYYKRAQKTYKKALSWYPEQGDIHYNITLAQARTGPIDEESDSVKKAARLRPYDSRVLSIKARLQTQNKDHVAAASTAKKAVRVAPNNIDARKIYATALENNKNFAKSVKQFIELLEKEPPVEQQIELHQLAAEVYHMFLDELSSAEKHYKKAIDLLSQSPLRSKLKKRLEKVQKTLEKKHRRREGKPPKKLESASPPEPVQKGENGSDDSNSESTDQKD